MRGHYRRLRALDPWVQERFDEVSRRMASYGYTIIIAWRGGLRTVEEQEELWRQGRVEMPSGEWVVTDPRRVVTYARGLDGPHPHGLAWDAAFLLSAATPGEADCHGETLDRYTQDAADNLPWDLYGRCVEESGLRWGGRFPHADRPHAEHPRWRELANRGPERGA